MHGRFRDAVHVHQLGLLVAVALKPRTKIGEIEWFSSKDHVAQRERLRETGFLDLDDLVERGQRLVQHGHVFLGQQVVEVLWRPRYPVRNHHQPAAGQQATQISHTEKSKA